MKSSISRRLPTMLEHQLAPQHQLMVVAGAPRPI
jgi:hypothetical protein